MKKRGKQEKVNQKRRKNNSSRIHFSSLLGSNNAVVKLRELKFILLKVFEF